MSPASIKNTLAIYVHTNIGNTLESFLAAKYPKMIVANVEANYIEIYRKEDAALLVPFKKLRLPSSVNQRSALSTYRIKFESESKDSIESQVAKGPSILLSQKKYNAK